MPPLHHRFLSLPRITHQIISSISARMPPRFGKEDASLSPSNDMVDLSRIRKSRDSRGARCGSWRLLVPMMVMSACLAACVPPTARHSATSRPLPGLGGVPVIRADVATVPRRIAQVLPETALIRLNCGAGASMCADAGATGPLASALCAQWRALPPSEPALRGWLVQRFEAQPMRNAARQ
jgi:hypothetical protein